MEGAAAAIEGFASERRLELADRSQLRRATPALAGAAAEGPLASGELDDGGEATLAQLAESAVVLANVPEVRAYSSQICCHDRRELGRSRPASYPNESWEEVRLESAAFERRYRLIVLRGQHGGWMRELFAPTLIAWLAEDAPPGLSFEVNEGWVCVVMPGRIADPAAAGALWEAAGALVARIRAEALEEDDAPNLFDAGERERSLERPLAAIGWERPPASVAEAGDAFRARARRRPTVLALGAATALVLGAIGAALGYLVFGILAALAGLTGGLSIGWTLGRELGSYRHRFDGWNSASLGAHAFMREHARSRGLTLRDPARFHHDHRALPLPGRAETVQAGPAPGTGFEALFVMLSDAPEMRASGAGSIDPTDRPFARDVLIAELSPPPSAAELDRLELPDGWRADRYGERAVAISRPLAGNSLRTLEGCDEFRSRAGGLLAGLPGRAGSPL